MKAVSELMMNLSRLPTPEAALAAMDARPAQTPFVVSFVNQHGLNLALKDARFRANLLSADMLLRDGKGMELACRVFGLTPGANLNGTDLIPRLLARHKGRRIALFGTAEPWLGIARSRLEGTGHSIVTALDGFRDEADYVAAAQEFQPDIIVLAMGMPRQEAVAARLSREIAGACLIVNGGAILDFMAGRVSRAPAWMRGAGLEWAYRLLCEPRRLARRYILGIPIFALHVLRARYGIKAEAEG